MISAFGVIHELSKSAEGELLGGALKLEAPKGFKPPKPSTGGLGDKVSGFKAGLQGKTPNHLDLGANPAKTAGMASGAKLRGGTLKAVKSPSFKPAAIGVGAGAAGAGGIALAHRGH